MRRELVVTVGNQEPPHEHDRNDIVEDIDYHDISWRRRACPAFVLLADLAPFPARSMGS